jgi:outer membrane protein OmpU
MKKILFASTALILSAGVASANNNISFSGDARMGVVYNSANVAPAAKTQFSARARMTIRMSRTTDTGLQVGATFRVDQGGAAVGNTSMTGGTVFISGDFGRLTMGDIAGAVEGVIGQLPNIGYSELRQGAQWLSNAEARRTAVRYEYSFDGFTVMLSSDQLQQGPAKTGYAGIGVKYSFDGFSVALGHETGKLAGVSDRHTMIGAEASLDMVTLKALYGERKTGATKTKQYGVSASANIDAVNVTAYYMRRLNTSKNYGIGASYSLGGGAHLRGAINQTSLGGVKTNTADFGVTMSF